VPVYLRIVTRLHNNGNAKATKIFRSHIIVQVMCLGKIKNTKLFAKMKKLCAVKCRIPDNIQLRIICFSSSDRV